jgi:LysR family transcriptional activator of nhaA
LLRVFAEEGFGVFAVPTVMEEPMRHYGFHKVGATGTIKVRFYAISVELKVRHPAVVAVCDAARSNLFPGRQTASSS